MTVLLNDPIEVKVEWEGDATGNATWGQRPGGSATFDDANSATTFATMSSPGATTVTVYLRDPDGYADPNPSDSKAINFWVVDA